MSRGYITGKIQEMSLYVKDNNTNEFTLLASSLKKELENVIIKANRDTGLNCKNEKRIYEGDTVSFCGHQGKVVYEYGTFGIVVEDGIDYFKLQAFMDEHQDECCGNEYRGCENDNFISLWEIYWNFCCIENYLWMVEKIEESKE